MKQIIQYKLERNQEIVTGLGKDLYLRMAKAISSESFQVNEQECIDFMNFAINRTCDGYVREIDTIYGQLHVLLGVKLEAAPDEWDRLFNVDFFIKIGENYIGIQIKPVNNSLQIPEIHKEYALQAKTHQKFKEKYGGAVFYVYSEKVNGRKEIANKEVVEEIRKEIERLSTK